MIVCTWLMLSLAAAPAAPAPVAVVPFTDNGKLVALHVRVGGSAPRAFTLDSGASASVIDTATANELHMRAAGSRLGTGAGAGKVRFALHHDVPLALGAARWVAPTMYGISLNGVGTAQHEDGQFHVTFDYSRNRMYLAKS